MDKWYNLPGDNGEVVVSTRVRLARNLEKYPFPGKLGPAEKKQVNTIIRDALLGKTEKELKFIDMNQLSRLQAASLAERRLISAEFASDALGRALMISEDESVSIMLCEEDHVRIQITRSGLSADSAFAEADKIDDVLISSVQLAFDDKLGFLTSSPANLGTAMRASLILHLPALSRNEQIRHLSSTVSRLGMSIRGAFEEGTMPTGDLYQLSNRVTVGINEKTAIINLKSIAAQIIAQETALREKMIESTAWLDKIYRSLGILQNARILTYDELMQAGSLVRLGAAAGLIPIPLEVFSNLMTNAQPATLQVSQSETMDAPARNILRANIVREIFS